MESSCQQKTNTNSHIGLQKKLKYSTFDDPDGSRLHSVIILDVEYIKLY